jgi:hypothetical protein
VIYAVGDSGTIVKYNEGSWSVEASSTDADLYGVWGSSETNVFAVGAQGTIVHYDGVSWSDVASGTNVDLNGVWGSLDNDVYAVGVKGTIIYYDGESWSNISSGTDVDLYGIWGSSDDNVYVVGGQGTIIHYDGVEEQKCVLENLYRKEPVKLATLRNYRDTVLNTTLQGKLVVGAYYSTSPVLAALIKHNKKLRHALKNIFECILPSLGVVNE